jgi:hypothetical protein
MTARNFDDYWHTYRTELKLTTTERWVFESLALDGYTVVRPGWPDLLAVRGDECRFVEVKAHAKDKPTALQRRVFELLEHHVGIPVEVIHPGQIRLFGADWRAIKDEQENS